MKKRGEAISETYLQAIAKGAWGSYEVLSRRAAGLRPALLRYAQKYWFVVVLMRVFQHRDTTLHPRRPQRNSPFVRLLDLEGDGLQKPPDQGTLEFSRL